MSCSCQWYRVCDAGALRAEPLATLMSCAVKTTSRHNWKVRGEEESGGAVHNEPYRAGCASRHSRIIRRRMWLAGKETDKAKVR